MQAALGASQMGRLVAFVNRRRALANRYDTLLAELPIDLPERLQGCLSSWHLYVIRLKDPTRRRPVFEALRADGIGVNVHYIPVHMQPYYQDLGFAPGDFPVSEDYYSRAISIPLYPGMTEDDQNKVIESLRRILEG